MYIMTTVFNIKLRKKTKLLSFVLLLILIFTFSFGCSESPSAPKNSPSYVFNTPGAPSTPTNSLDDNKELTYTDITLLNAGDIMYHAPQFKSAYVSSTGKYNFMDNFQYMKPIVSAADYAVVNFETTTAHQNSYTSYPTFNSPLEVYDSIKDAGFDMLLYANNHCYDI